MHNCVITPIHHAFASTEPECGIIAPMARTSFSPPLAAGVIPDVAIILESGCIGQRLLKGINRYLRMYGPWNLYLELGNAERTDLLSRWRGHGIIARVRGPMVVRALAQHYRIPMILDREPVSSNRSWRPHLMDFQFHPEPLICDYFLSKGFRHFAFCPMPGGESWGRQSSLMQALKQRGYECHVFPGRPTAGTTLMIEDHRQLLRWLQQLPKPLALVTASDLRAYKVIELCRSIPIHIPDELAVLGYDNDSVLCELCNPPLTSIEAPVEEAGYRAAQTLHALMLGLEPPDLGPMPECRLVVRQSTDMIAIEDPDVRQAIAIIYAKATSGLTVKELLHEVKMSRRSLERLFLKTLGRSPGVEIRNLQLQRARQLLAETSLPIRDVAQRSGFANATRLGEAMKRSLGQTPAGYRLAYRPTL